MSRQWLGKVAVLRFGHGDTKEPIEVIAYCEFPTIEGHAVDGERIHWCAHLAREATPEEAVAYWRERALRAEADAAAAPIRRTPADPDTEGERHE